MSAEPFNLRAWLVEVDRQAHAMRPATPAYRRFDDHARRLTVEALRAAWDAAAAWDVSRRLRACRYPSGHAIHDLDRVWSRAELGELIVEATNRYRQLLAMAEGRPEREKGPQFDPSRLPDERLDVLIQRHRDMAVVEALRAERWRRAGQAA